MTFVLKSALDNRPNTDSIALCAVPYHWRGSLLVGFMACAQLNAASDMKVRLSITTIVSGPQVAGTLPSLHLSSSLRPRVKPAGTPARIGPMSEDLILSRR